MEIGTLRLQFVKCSCRTQSAAASYGKFAYKDRQSKQHEKDKIDQDKSGAAVFTCHVWEFPYISKTYSTSC